jgi:hypothetical protein
MDTLAQLEQAILGLNAKDITVQIMLPINQDPPRGYVEYGKPPMDRTLFRKVLDAEGGIANKIIEISIPD